MSRALMLCLSGLALAAASPSLTSAQIQPPHLRPGEWDTVISMMGMTMNSQMCMDEFVEARAKAFQAPAMGAGGQRNCSPPDMRAIPGGMHVDTTCTTGRGAVHTSMEVTGDFQNNYRMDMTIRPENGPEQKISSTARYVGECPAGMKPGQVVMKMDMGAMAGMAAAAAAAARQNQGR